MLQTVRVRSHLLRRLRLGSQEHKSRVCRGGGRNPVWNQTFQFSVRREKILELVLMDEDKFKADELIGFGTVSLERVRGAGRQVVQAPISAGKKLHKQQGHVLLTLEFVPTPGCSGVCKLRPSPPADIREATGPVRQPLPPPPPPSAPATPSARHGGHTPPTPPAQAVSSSLSAPCPATPPPPKQQQRAAVQSPAAPHRPADGTGESGSKVGAAAADCGAPATAGDGYLALCASSIVHAGPRSVALYGVPGAAPPTPGTYLTRH